MSTMRSLLATATALCALSACDRVSGTSDSNVSVQLTSAAPVATAAGADSLVLSASNGKLVLTDLRLIVARLKLDGSEHSCASAQGEGKNCKDFTLPPSFAQVPLATGAVTVAAGSATPGTYTEVELRVKNFDVSDDDDEDDMDDDADHGNRAALAQALADARAAYPDWPDRASMVVTGRFTPAGDGQQSKAFKVYFRAELKVELDLVPPLVVTETGASRTVTVTLTPEAWFTGTDGKVADLSAFDFAKTNKVVEFKASMKKGFRARHDG